MQYNNVFSEVSRKTAGQLDGKTIRQTESRIGERHEDRKTDSAINSTSAFFRRKQKDR